MIALFPLPGLLARPHARPFGSVDARGVEAAEPPAGDEAIRSSARKAVAYDPPREPSADRAWPRTSTGLDPFGPASSSAVGPVSGRHRGAANRERHGRSLRSGSSLSRCAAHPWLSGTVAFLATAACLLPVDYGTAVRQAVAMLPPRAY